MISIIGRANRRAFTLIEVLLVIIIAAVVFTLAAPNFSRGYMHLQLNKTAEDLLNLSRWAQAQAIGRGQVYALAFGEDGRSYRMMRSRQEAGYEEEFDPIEGKLGRERRVAEGVDITINEGHINFYPDGVINPVEIQLMAMNKRITLSSTQVRGMMLRLDEE